MRTTTHETTERTTDMDPRHFPLATASRIPLAFLALLALAACGQPPDEADDDAAADDHEHEATAVVTQWNDATELFLEYPFLQAGQATGNWAIHLTDMDDFKPITSGTLTVRFEPTDQPDNPPQTFTLEAPARDGIFLLDPVVEEPGTYRVELALESPQATSTHVVPGVYVYSEPPHVHPEEEGGGIAFLKEQQWRIDFAVARATEDTVRRTVAAPAELVAPDGARVEVTAPAAGIALAGPNRGAPSAGQRVREGQLLAVLSPTAQDGGWADTRARVERLEREVARAERLFEAGAIAGKRLQEARHDLEVARAQAEALGGGAEIARGDDPEGYRLRVTSPMTGVVARRGFVPGGRVEAGSPLFTLVDPSAAWLRVHVPAGAGASVPAGARTTFALEGSPDGGAPRGTARLVAVGSVLDPETRTVPATFAVENGPAGPPFTFGQLARAWVPVGGAAVGVTIPNDAIVDDNGLRVAYVQAGGETFERRILSLGPTDGARTLVESGIEAGEMVVTAGAYQVRLASMSGDEFAGGHTH